MQVSAPVPVLLVHVCRLCVGISALTTPKCAHNPARLFLCAGVYAQRRYVWRAHVN